MNLKDRINSCLKEKNVKKTDLARATKSPRATVSDWTSGKTEKLSGDKLLLVAKFFNVSPEWLQTGKGEKYWEKETGYLYHQYQLYPYTTQPESPEAAKLVNIISATERAMKESGYSFTEEERIDNFFLALDFAGRKSYSNGLVNQYLKEMIAQTASKAGKELSK